MCVRGLVLVCACVCVCACARACELCVIHISDSEKEPGCVFFLLSAPTNFKPHLFLPQNRPSVISRPSKYFDSFKHQGQTGHQRLQSKTQHPACFSRQDRNATHATRHTAYDVHVAFMNSLFICHGSLSLRRL